MDKQTNSSEKDLYDVLREIFQFDASDLDFGIYRILNYKRNQIKEFISKDLKKKVEMAFSKYREEFEEKLKEKKKEIMEIADKLRKKAFTSDEELYEEFKDTPLGEEFLALKEQIENIKKMEHQVFVDLYNFFSRYYEGGDFIPQLRYSTKRSYKYAIPYNGEEVKLYWANQDQYYVKTGILFRDYTFIVGDYRVIFRIENAREEIGSNKATKERFFVLDDEKPVDKLEDEKSLIVHFQYRELTKEEVERYNVGGGSTISKQEKINEKSYKCILNKIKDSILKTDTSDKCKKCELLLYHLNRFTAKNKKDYFIHKDLKTFLEEQLDYFIKSEVLDIEMLEKEKLLDIHITRAKVVREIGKAIIDFLAQIEDFQKKLWEKKKFVLKTEYVITLDKIKEYGGSEFINEILEEILKNKEQLDEWEKLGFGSIKSKKDLLAEKNLVTEEYKKLPVDTKHFPPEFKEKLLEKLTENADLDDLLDGILIKSENWQALNLLLNKYKEKIQVIYIDPPYNTGSDGFLYRDNYKHSSWLTMMENRLSLARELMRDDGVIFVSIDDREVERLKLLLIDLLGQEKFISQITRDIPDGTNLTTRGGVKVSTEYILYFIKAKEPLLNDSLIKSEVYKSIVKNFSSDYIETRLTKNGNKIQTIKFPKGIGSFDIKVDVEKKEGEFINPKSVEKIKVSSGNLIIKSGILQDDVELEAGWSMPNVLNRIFAGEEVYDDAGQKYEGIFFNRKGIPYIRKIRKKALIPSYLNIPNEKDDLFIDLFGFNESPKEATPKPVSLIELLINLTKSNSSSIILDFFAGSGTTAHAVMKLNKEDEGKRKFILVEMADYFDTVIIPRIKKVAYSFNWKDGKPQDTYGLGVFFKYHYLEQYEDTLDNIELKENKRLNELFKDEYLLKYFLYFETRESPYLLNLEHLKNPFSYKLKVNLSEVGKPKEEVVDIPETFNYLLGIKVKKIKVRKNKRKYLFILGEKEGGKVAIVWREYDKKWKEEDYKEDKDFINSELKGDWEPHIIYINGQSALTPNGYEIKYIEPEFKKLMEV